MESTDLTWRKTSHSSNGGAECVEVVDHGHRVLVRDTKDRTGPMLRFTPGAWRRFADQVKRSLAIDRLPARCPETPRGGTKRPGEAWLAGGMGSIRRRSKCRYIPS
jgi:Domain of unknown function (DUF397)